MPRSKKAPKQVVRLIEDDGVDRLLVWGGDGTVRRVLTGIVLGAVSVVITDRVLRRRHHELATH